MDINQIMLNVELEFGSSGLVDGLCGDFAREVAKRAIAFERESCAIVCETPINVDGTNIVASRFAKAIRAREPNVRVNRPAEAGRLGPD